MTDEEFQAAIELLAGGNKDALKRIYESYVKLIYAVVYDTVKNREDAEDITSEFFIKLVRVAGGFKKGSPHKAWLITIAKNMSIDAIRKSKREIVVSDTESEGGGDILDNMAADANPGVSLVEDSAVMAEDMRRAMKSLTPKEKEIVDLKLIGQLKFKEISQMTGQPMGTVTWLYNQGITKLRRCLADYGKG